MTHETDDRHSRPRARLALIWSSTALLFAALLTAPAAAAAGHDGPVLQAHYKHRAQSPERHRRHASNHWRHERAEFRFDVPRRIFRADLVHYRPYHHGTAYYRPHRHRHTVYAFPVRTARGYRYRPHYYCEGRLYSARSSHGPRGHVSLHLGF